MTHATLHWHWFDILWFEVQLQNMCPPMGWSPRLDVKHKVLQISIAQTS